MTSLSSKRQSFVNMMTTDEDYERRGFDLLAQRPDLASFFEALADAKLFEAQRNPGPLEADTTGRYRIPVWPPLPYLEAVARLAGEKADIALAGKVMSIVREVSQWHDSHGKTRDNYWTWQSFAKIIGLVPIGAVASNDINLVAVWLSGQFNRSVVTHALLTGPLRKFVDSSDREDWGKACLLLRHLTALSHVNESPELEVSSAPDQTVVDNYWLNEIIQKTCASLGRKLGKDTADLFLSRVTDLYSRAMNGTNTFLFRPAIEEHTQNFESRGPYNYFVTGLRDTVNAWLDSDPDAARTYVDALLASNVEIVERIGIYLVDQRFAVLREFLPHAISPRFFDAPHRHELFNLLKNHFQQFADKDKAAVLDAIRALPLPTRGEDPERLLHYSQRRWLKAIEGTAYDPVMKWLAQLNSSLGEDTNFLPPDFSSYHQTKWGFGPTPHGIEELAALARAGTIVEKLNQFVPSHNFDGPSTRSLCDALVEAVTAAPDAFLDQLPSFKVAKPEYKYAIIAGFRKLWDEWDGITRQELSWGTIWPTLIGFFESLLDDDVMWASTVEQAPPLSPTLHWIVPEIAEFIQSGTRSDARAFGPDLLPRTSRLVEMLLRRSTPQSETVEGDELNSAINTSKGKSIEALFNYTLRRCRLNDQSMGSHEPVWQELRHFFDNELAQCRNSNFEFSALAAAHIGNLEYMNSQWVHSNIRALFPIEYPANCVAALNGLAYAPPIKSIFDALMDASIVDWAIKRDLKGRYTREALLQRLGLSYLLGDESLSGPRFSHLFQHRLYDDLEELVRYFWRVRDQSLNEDQIERIFAFWDFCIAWSKTLDLPPRKLLSALGLLSCFIAQLDELASVRLIEVAPFVSTDYNADYLIEQLSRIEVTNPAAAGRVLRALLDSYSPIYDFENRLRTLIARLAMRSDTRADAIYSLERVRHLAGMQQLYNELTE